MIKKVIENIKTSVFKDDLEFLEEIVDTDIKLLQKESAKYEILVLELVLSHFKKYQLYSFYVSDDIFHMTGVHNEKLLIHRFAAMELSGRTYESLVEDLEYAKIFESHDNFISATDKALVKNNTLEDLSPYNWLVQLYGKINKK